MLCRIWRDWISTSFQSLGLRFMFIHSRKHWKTFVAAKDRQISFVIPWKHQVFCSHRFLHELTNVCDIDYNADFRFHFSRMSMLPKTKAPRNVGEWMEWRWIAWRLKANSTLVGLRVNSLSLRKPLSIWLDRRRLEAKQGLKAVWNFLALGGLDLQDQRDHLPN